MAIINKETLFNTENLNGAKWSFGVPLERTNPVPIDKWSVFETYADAVEFVNKADGNIAYPGQMITIEDPTTNVVDVYVVDRTATDCLKKLASGGSADEILRKLTELSSQLLSADGIIDQLSAAHDALSVALSTEIEALSTSLSNETKAEIEALSVALSTDVQALSTALSTEIEALSTSLSNETKAEIEALSTALSTEIDALSDALSADVKALSVALSTEISAETEARIEAINALSDILSAEVSATLTAANKYTDDAVEALSGMLSTAWHFVGVSTVDPAEGTPVVDGYTADFKSGDVVIFKRENEDGTGTVAVEFVYDGTTWQELGDESLNATRTYVDNAIEALSTALSTDLSAEKEARDEAVKALSVALSTDLSAEKEARDEAIKALSVALSTDLSAEKEARDEAIKALSVALSTDLSAEKLAREEAVQDLSDALSADIQALSTALSTEISALNSDADKKIEALSVALSTDISALSAGISADVKALSDAISADVAALSDGISADVKALSTALSTEIEALSTSLSNETKAEIEALSVALSTDVEALSVALSTEISAETERAKEAEEGLSTAIDNKIKYSETIDGSDAISVGTFTVHKVGQAEYEAAVVAKTLVETDLYIVSSEYLNGYGQVAKNLADGVDASDAATVGQLSTVSADLQQQINDSVKNGVEKLSTMLSTDIKALSVALSTEISAETIARDEAVKALSVALSTDVKNLSVALSTDIKALSVALSTEISALDEAADEKVKALSVALSTDVKALSVALSTDVKALSVALSTDVKALSVALSTEISAMAEDLEAWKNTTGLSAAGKDGEYQPTDNQVVLWKNVKDITSAMHFRDAITSSETKTIEAALAEIAEPKKGDVVIDTATAKEYVYTGEAWRELGDEGMYCTKSEFNAFKQSTELSVENLSAFAADLRTDVDTISADLSAEIERATAAESSLAAALAAEVAARTAGDEEVLATQVSAVVLNGQSFTVENHVATLSVEIINCGGANLF